MQYEDIEITEFKLKQRLKQEKQLQPYFDELADIMTRRVGKVFSGLRKQDFTRKEAIEIVKNMFLFDFESFLLGDEERPRTED